MVQWHGQGYQLRFEELLLTAVSLNKMGALAGSLNEDSIDLR